MSNSIATLHLIHPNFCHTLVSVLAGLAPCLEGLAHFSVLHDWLSQVKHSVGQCSSSFQCLNLADTGIPVSVVQHVC